MNERVINNHPIHKIQKSTLESWDEITADGSFGAMTEVVRQLIEDNDGLTVKELLKLATDWGNDRNKIAPKVTYLVEHGVVVRPTRRRCTVTKRIVSTHSLAPETWFDHRLRLVKNFSRKKVVKNRIETESKTTPGKFHTTIEWWDGTVSCTCSQEYHRPSHILCHHAKGLELASTGKLPGEDWKAMYEELKKKYDELEKELNEQKHIYDN